MPLSTNLPKNWSYEATVEQIEAAIARLEQGELPLVAVFEEFEQAVQQLKQCENFLQSHQERVELLIETLEEDV